jgi:LytS/YehU family sensor histidine kinase
MIYESREEFIPLTDEIQLLKNYIDLERLRYGQELDFSITISGNPGQKWIRPLLLIPLLENSFKYGMSQQINEKWISLEIQINEERLHFNLANSKNSGLINPKNNRREGGVGLENVRRRLELLYCGEYSLDISNEEHQFRIILDLPLKGKLLVQDVASEDIIIASK